jgi:hypothetical protein
MLFMKYRDFEPRQESKEYCLGLMIHDDGDVVKWDWTIYKEFDNTAMYEEVCNLDVSPYERNEHKINQLFLKQVAKLLDNDSKRK